ncbi:hypothetical protein [Chitinilyticum litopenaei]|uniref:hypothetical protein n=1 Tax=Chitinilyticum litopenaei TaxID=1121276 RepID=UPI00040F2941|nr:hypothetical protein [Chitinilyticum litopenaei]
MSIRLNCLLLLLASGLAQAVPFCLYPLPVSEGKPARMINLTVVQYVDLTDRELKISFGGGNLGSGHEVSIPLKNRREGEALLAAMADASRRCDQPPAQP